MKVSKYVFVLLPLFLLFFSCRNDIQIDQPVGNYLHLEIGLPSQGGSESANRAIHEDSTVLVVSLTYPGKAPIVAEFPFSLDAEMSVFVDKLAPANDVVLDVSIGLSADLPLTSSSTTINIKPGGNTADITLAYNVYTINGTLYKSDGSTLLPNQSIEVDGTALKTDANGKFSFNLSTENWSEYSKISVPINPDTEIYNFARTKKALINDHSNFKLIARGEVFIDLTVSSELYPIEGAELTISSELGYITSSPIKADANGKIVFQEVMDAGISDPGGDHSVSLEYKGVFVPVNIQQGAGSPGAIIDDVVMNPYVIFVSQDTPGELEKFMLYAMDFDSTNTVPESSLSVDTISGFTLLANNSQGVRVTCDYKNGNIYLGVISSASEKSIFKMSGWNGAVTSVSIVGELEDSSTLSSIQQIIPVDGGSNLLVTATYGALLISTNTMTVTTVWKAPNDPTEAIILNGGYQSSDGTYYAMGEIYDNSGALEGTQKIYRLNSNATINQVSTLPSSYNVFNLLGITSGAWFNSMIGLYPWGDSVMSVKTQDTANTEIGGVIMSMKSWSLDKLIDSSFDYLVPVGVLPDNRFYVVNETKQDYSDKKVLRMNSPSDSSIETKAYMSNPSGISGQSMFYYLEASSIPGV